MYGVRCVRSQEAKKEKLWPWGDQLFEDWGGSMGLRLGPVDYDWERGNW